MALIGRWAELTGSAWNIIAALFVARTAVSIVCAVVMAESVLFGAIAAYRRVRCAIIVCLNDIVIKI